MKIKSVIAFFKTVDFRSILLDGGQARMTLIKEETTNLAYFKILFRSIEYMLP